MSHVCLEINSLEDARAGKSLFKELDGQTIKSGTVSHFGILEGGMESGATSLIVMIKLEDGTYAMGQLSVAIFDGLAAGVKGAEERFKNK